MHAEQDIQRYLDFFIYFPSKNSKYCIKEELNIRVECASFGFYN